MGCIQSSNNNNPNNVKTRIDISNSSKKITLEEKNNLLLHSTYKGTPEFTIKDYETWARVVKVYDGDSCHVTLFIGNDMFRIPCRVNGIDTPELRSDDPLEVKHAIRAKEYFINMVKDGLVWVHVHKKEKYGRFLTTIYSDEKKNINIADNMIQEGYGYKYKGDTKVPFREWYDHEKFANYGD